LQARVAGGCACKQAPELRTFAAQASPAGTHSVHSKGCVGLPVCSLIPPPNSRLRAQVRRNAAALGTALTKRGYKLVTGGTGEAGLLLLVVPAGLVRFHVPFCKALCVSLAAPCERMLVAVPLQTAWSLLCRRQPPDAVGPAPQGHHPPHTNHLQLYLPTADSLAPYPPLQTTTWCCGTCAPRASPAARWRRRATCATSPSTRTRVRINTPVW